MSGELWDGIRFMMKEEYDFSKGRKNPYAQILKKEGYTTIVHYSPEDVNEMEQDDELLLSVQEVNALEEYEKNMKNPI